MRCRFVHLLSGNRHPSQNAWRPAATTPLTSAQAQPAAHQDRHLRFISSGTFVLQDRFTLSFDAHPAETEYSEQPELSAQPELVSRLNRPDEAPAEPRPVPTNCCDPQVPENFATGAFTTQSGQFLKEVDAAPMTACCAQFPHHRKQIEAAPGQIPKSYSCRICRMLCSADTPCEASGAISCLGSLWCKRGHRFRCSTAPFVQLTEQKLWICHLSSLTINWP